MERLLFLDILKAFGILLVIFVHMQNFLAAIVIPNFVLIEGLKFLGLTCFTFASGYAIHANNRTLEDRGEILHFYKKRVLRIYPLYLAAIFVFFLCFQVFGLFPAIHYGIGGWIANILCLQVLLAPAFLEPVFTLWFIGFIMIMYAIYPLFSDNRGSIAGRILIAAGLFIVLAVLHVTLEIVDYRFFIYYFVFIAGIVASERNRRFLFIEKPFRGHKKIAVPLVIALAYSSFCIYLFHMPVFTVTNIFITGAGLSGALQNAAVIFLVIPVMFCMCYFIQRSYDRLVRRAGMFSRGGRSSS